MKQSFVWMAFGATEEQISLFPTESVLKVYRLFQFHCVQNEPLTRARRHALLK
jgi:hypothetical protein